MTFAWPWILLLLPLPWWWQKRANRQTADGTTPVIPPRLRDALQALADSSATQKSEVPLRHWCCWCLLLLALAQPCRPGDAVIQPASGRAMTLAIDLSSSMARRDFSLDGESADRLSVVKRLAGQFIEQRIGDRVGLVLFGKEAFVASAPSFDVGAVHDALRAAGIGMAGGSTAIGDALGLALTSLRDDPASEKAIVLLSDGTSNAGSVEPEAAAGLARSLGIRIHTIGLASEVDQTTGSTDRGTSADLDTDALKAVARAAGGQFFRAATSADLEQVFTAIDTLSRAEVEAPPAVPVEDLRWIPLVLLLLALLWQGGGTRAPVAMQTWWSRNRTSRSASSAESPTVGSR